MRILINQGLVSQIFGQGFHWQNFWLSSSWLVRTRYLGLIWQDSWLSMVRLVRFLIVLGPSGTNLGYLIARLMAVSDWLIRLLVTHRLVGELRGPPAG